MSTIGALTKRSDGSFLGTLNLKSYTGRTLFQPVGPKPSATAPDYRIFGAGDHGGRFEMGAAWIKTRADGQGTYVSVKIDYPEIAAPIYATLGAMAGQDDPDVYAIIWNRPGDGRGAPGGDSFAGSVRTAEPLAATEDAFAGLEDEGAPSVATGRPARGRGRGPTPDAGFTGPDAA